MNQDNKELIRILKSLKTDPEFGPAAEFRADLKQRLMAEIPEADWFAAWPEFFRGGWGKLAWAIAGVVLMVAGTTTVLAQNSLPTDKLYPVKIAGERAVMAVARDEWKPQIAAGIAERRLDEIHQLEKNEETEAVAGAVDNYRRHLTQAEHFRNGADEEWAAGINRHWETLKQLEEKLAAGATAAPTAPTAPARPATIAPRPTVAVETQSPAGEKHNQEDDNKKSKQEPAPANVNPPIIQLTIPANIPVIKDLPLNLLP